MKAMRFFVAIAILVANLIPQSSVVYKEDETVMPFVRLYNANTIENLIDSNENVIVGNKYYSKDLQVNYIWDSESSSYSFIYDGVHYFSDPHLTFDDNLGIYWYGELDIGYDNFMAEEFSKKGNEFEIVSYEVQDDEVHTSVSFIRNRENNELNRVVVEMVYDINTLKLSYYREIETLSSGVVVKNRCYTLRYNVSDDDLATETSVISNVNNLIFQYQQKLSNEDEVKTIVIKQKFGHKTTLKLPVGTVFSSVILDLKNNNDDIISVITVVDNEEFFAVEAQHEGKVFFNKYR